MIIVNQEAWETKTRSTDPGDQEVCQFAEAWADRMEHRIAQGDSIEACWESMMDDVQQGGWRPLLYGQAIALLSTVWVHGEALHGLFWRNVRKQREEKQ